MTDASASTSNDHELNPENRTALENLLQKQALHGQWGYKNISDPVERDLALRSEAMAESIFAVLYADDPDNARSKWQTFTGKPADNGLVARAKNFVVERDKKQVVEKLSSQQEMIQTSVDEVRKNNADRMRQQNLARLQANLGDMKQRALENKHRMNRTLGETDNNIDGLTVIKSFYRGGKVAADFRAVRNDKKKAKMCEAEIREVLRDEQDKMVKNARLRAVSPDFEAKNEPAAQAAAKHGMQQHAANVGSLKGANMAHAMANAPKRFADFIQKTTAVQTGAQRQSPPQVDNGISR